MKIEFTAFPRTVQGTGASRRLRGGGKVPGIVYGADKPAQPIELDHHALYRHLKMEAFHASILDMTFEGDKQQVLLRDVQMHPFKQMVLHVDFQRVDKNRKIHMKVPLHFINAEICPGVKVGRRRGQPRHERSRYPVSAGRSARVHRGQPREARARPFDAYQRGAAAERRRADPRA